MRVKRRYNNNVILSKNSKGEEVILVGRGIGYGLKVDDKIDETRIEKKFELKSSVNNKFKELIQDVSIEDILICEKVVSFIKENNKKELDDYIYLTLTDHIVNMLERIKKGINFDFAILLNIRALYKDEYMVALKAVELLEENYNIKIDESEANFITLHIVNSESNSNMMELYKISSIIDAIIEIVEKHFKVNKDDFDYDRFITHCRFFVQRVVKKEYLNDDSLAYESMLDLAKGIYQTQFDCVNEIANYINNKYHYMVGDNEKMYLLLHLVKLTN